MDAIAPMFALVVFAAQDAEQWKRFPTVSFCLQQETAARMCFERLERDAATIGGLAGDRMLCQAAEMRRVMVLWEVLRNLASQWPDCEKRRHSEWARQLVGDRAWMEGDWPVLVPDGWEPEK